MYHTRKFHLQNPSTKVLSSADAKHPDIISDSSFMEVKEDELRCSGLPNFCEIQLILKTAEFLNRK